jgi:hypothetical protein
MKIYEWQGQILEVRVLPLKQYYYLLCGIEVRTGNRTFLPRNLNEAGFYRTHTEFELMTGSGLVQGTARSLAPVLLRPRLKTEISVGDEVIGQDVLAIDNWKAYYAACFVMGAAGGLFLGWLT